MLSNYSISQKAKGHHDELAGPKLSPTPSHPGLGVFPAALSTLMEALMSPPLLCTFITRSKS